MRRAWRLIQTRWTLRLHVAWHAGLASLLLRRRRQAGATSASAGHDALEEVRRSMSNARRRRLRRSAVLALRWTSTCFELVTEAGDLFLIPAGTGQMKHVITFGYCLLCELLAVRGFQLIYLRPHQFHLTDLGMH